jgi:hypothetical protein
MLPNHFKVALLKGHPGSQRLRFSPRMPFPKTRATLRPPARGARPDLVGKNDLNTPDANGKLFIKEIVAIDKNGWFDYKFKSPAGNQIHDKSSYFVRVGDFLVGSRAYHY